MSLAPLVPPAATSTDVAQVLIVLGAVALGLAALGRLASRRGISPIPFYLLAGIALGAARPFDLGDELIDVGSEIGVVLLLFMLGLEYSGEELQQNLRSGLPAGLVDLGLNFPPGLALGLALGWDPRAALLLGGVTYISSSGIIAKVLADLDRLGNRETPAILSVLVLEDLAMALFLPMVAALIVGGTLLVVVGEIALAVTAAAAALFVALRLGRRISAAIVHPSDEVVLLTTFGLVLIVAGIADRLQVSAAVGAFLVGIALGGEVAERARVLLGPLRDIFAAAFFLFFGLGIELGEIPPVLVAALALGALTTLTKIATGWWAAGRAGVARRGRARAGAALVARGEFSIVIAGIGVSAGLESELGPLAAAYVLVLALGGPFLARSPHVLVPLAAAAERVATALWPGRHEEAA